MKLKKIISAISAFAMVASMTVVANAASLGGKPTITATFDSYEKVSDTVAFAYVNITLDMTAAETLEVYSNELDEITWEEVIKGNGIKTMGMEWTVPTGFTYTKAKSTIPAGLTLAATTLAFGPKTAAEEYWVEPVTTIKLAYRVNNFDAKGDIAFTAGGSTIAGLNSAENGALWDYASAKDTITLTGCSIPSYNEWSKPAAPTTPVVSKLENGGAMYGMKTKVAKVEIPADYAAEKAIISDGEVTKEFDLPLSVKGASSFVAIIRYAGDVVKTFTLTVE